MVQSIGRAGAAHGLEVMALAYRGDGPFRQALERAGVETVFVPSRAGLDPTLAPRLAAVLRRRRVDVIHSHHLGPFLYGAVAARMVGVRHVHTEHSLELYDRPRRRAIGRLVPLLSRAVAVAPEVAAWHAGSLGARVEVVRNGIAIPPPREDAVVQAARARLGVPDGAFVVGSVGRLAPEKDHGTLIDAFARMLESVPAAHLAIVGDGREQSALLARIERLGIGPAVHMLGRRDDVEDLLPGFDVIALSSLREGLPLALLEGMAHGLPAVATAVGGIPGLLELGGGRVAAAADAAGLAAALTAYASDPALCRRDGETARRLVQARYSADAMVSRYAALYRGEP